MYIKKTCFDSKVILFKMDHFNDTRGYFHETFNKNKFKNILPETHFPLEGESLNFKKNTLRGLHFQNGDYKQSKIIRVLSGKILDVFVCINKNSSYFGQWDSIELDSKDMNQLYLSYDFAHGYLTTEDNTLISYRMSNYFSKSSSQGIVWNDKKLSINWNCVNPHINERDLMFPSFNECLNNGAFV